MAKEKISSMTRFPRKAEAKTGKRAPEKKNSTENECKGTRQTSKSENGTVGIMCLITSLISRNYFNTS